jgi:hypothetical protein
LNEIEFEIFKIYSYILLEKDKQIIDENIANILTREKLKSISNDKLIDLITLLLPLMQHEFYSLLEIQEKYIQMIEGKIS